MGSSAFDFVTDNFLTRSLISSWLVGFVRRSFTSNSALQT